jgi:archaellum component FlaC
MKANEFGVILEDIESQIRRLAEAMADVPADVRRLKEDVSEMRADLRVMEALLLNHEDRVTILENAN